MRKILFILLSVFTWLGLNLGITIAEEIELSTDRPSPSTSQFVNLTIETDEDYTGKLTFSIKYRSSTSASWTSISNLTSSTYFSDYSSTWRNGYYKMTSSDNGEVTLKNLVKFKKNGYYRIYVKNTDGDQVYIQFSVGQNVSNSDIELSTNKPSPSTSQFINLTIKTDEDYTGKLTFSTKYRSSTSASWSTVSSQTSSTYFSDYSSTWRNGYYKMTSSDDGEVTLKNLVKFKKKGYYRIFVKDTDGNENYIQFSVGQSDSNSDLKLSVSPSSPDTSEWVKLTIETDEDYTGKINFTKFQYRSSTSSSWSSISRTSSTYVSDYSTQRSNGYYKMTSSDSGEKIISKFIKFKKKGYYRIFAEDIDGNTTYIQINVDTSSSSSSDDDITLSTNDKTPSTSQFVNLTIETDENYTGKLTFSAKYRSSTSASWTSISNLTSSTYFSDYSDEWEDGYYKMKSSDDGEKTLKNLVKFKKKGYYRIFVKDTKGNQNYLQFSVGINNSSYDNSNVDGFTNAELSKVKQTYNAWDSMIAQMQRQYPHLKKNTYWKKLSSNFYDDMKDVVHNKSARDFDDYDDFKEAFDDWYEYTMRNV